MHENFCQEPKFAFGNSLGYQAQINDFEMLHSDGKSQKQHFRKKLLFSRRNA